MAPPGSIGIPEHPRVSQSIPEHPRASWSIPKDFLEMQLASESNGTLTICSVIRWSVKEKGGVGGWGGAGGGVNRAVPHQVQRSRLDIFPDHLPTPSHPLTSPPPPLTSRIDGSIRYPSSIPQDSFQSFIIIIIIIIIIITQPEYHRL